MLQEPSLIPDRILAAGLRSISRPNINFARSGPPIPNTPRTTGGPYFYTHGPGQRQTHITDLKNKVREETPLTPTPTPTSINWWPYPPWGQSTVSATPVASSFSAVAVAAVTSSVASASTIPLSATTSNATPNTPQVVIPISALPPTNTLPSNPRVQAATGSHFNILYLVPVFVAVGLALGALCGLLGYRWYSRRRARKGGPSNGIRTLGREGSSFIPGPPYIPMLDDTEDARTTLPTTTTSPSKYTRHGASRAGRSWLSAVARAGSRRGSTHSSSIPPSRGSTTRAATPSHLRPLSGSPTGARSRGSIISPGSLSDEENVPYETIRHTSIRRGILERLQRGIDRRAPSRRTTQTYLSAPSAYSGTHTEDSRAPSAIPSSESLRDTDWIPGSGFRIVEEAISSPIPPSTAALGSPTSASASVAGLPGRSASAWDDRAAIRQAVDAHPGERWLAWTRSWTSSPPQTNIHQLDRFTAVPARRRDDIGAALPRSPPQLTSGTLQSTLIFSPSLTPAVPRAATTDRRARAQPQARQSQPPRPLARATRLAAPAAVRGDSRASSIALGEGHGTPAMRYAARQTALARVEDILARSYSSRDLAPGAASTGSPNAFGAAAVRALSTEEEEEDVTLGAGIEQRLAAAATASNRRRQR
ncbi:hypothetical protein EDB89DRAFT_611254 [Lactarius sanguifluus]|nr:hypothetical protein EDB89DRAFT_611254 [Lactarius sanguifluus]